MTYSGFRKAYGGKVNMSMHEDRESEVAALTAGQDGQTWRQRAIEALGSYLGGDGKLTYIDRRWLERLTTAPLMGLVTLFEGEGADSLDLDRQSLALDELHREMEDLALASRSSRPSDDLRRAVVALLAGSWGPLERALAKIRRRG